MVKHWWTGLMLVCVAIMLIAHSAANIQKNYVQRSDVTHQHVLMQHVSTHNLKPNTAPHRPSDTSPIALSNAQTVENCSLLNTHDINLASANLASLPSPCPSSDYVSHSDDLDFAPHKFGAIYQSCPARCARGQAGIFARTGFYFRIRA